MKKSSKCIPCEGILKPLTASEIHDALTELKNPWKLISGKQICHEFKFKDFKEAMKFVNQVAALAEKERHHPDIDLHGWNKVTLSLSTHACKGLSVNDFVIAQKIEEMI